ncbi:methyltransferase domain-containing protein, partial [Candidatus Kaiserbacteria bacterium]|nr:methyltransferase domain-containing protein [Candidatus Kaiserbacteria bacterium]
MAKRNFIRKPKRRRHGTSFWDHEYAAGGGNLALSTDPGEDLEKFTRWLGRQKNIESLHQGARVLDVGCGNGRNLVFLAQEFRIRGTGFDSSTAAIKEAKELGAALPLSFSVSSMAE